MYLEAPFKSYDYIGLLEADHKFESALFDIGETDGSYLLEELEPHQYYAPAVYTVFQGTRADYDISITVDDILIKTWNGTFKSSYDEENYFCLEPADVMKYGGFDAGEHTVRVEVNGRVTEYTYKVEGTRGIQTIGPEASSLYLFPDQHILAVFTAEEAGMYTIRSEMPTDVPLFARLTDEDGNVLAGKEEADDDCDFVLSANLAEGQRVILEAWLISQENESRPFFGVVPVVVGEPFYGGVDLFEDARCMALVIGQTYQNAPKTISRLPGCELDALTMVYVLKNLAGTPYTVTMKLDLTAAEILAAIPETFAGATEKDVILFYYSGHGSPNNGALVGVDLEHVFPEALRQALDAIPATKIVLLDSCFSGNFIGRGEPGSVEKAALGRFVSAFSGTGSGTGAYYVLTASSMYETSVGYQFDCSLFTDKLVEGMGYDSSTDMMRTGDHPADTNQDGMYTLNELYVYCRDKINAKELGQTVCPWPYNCDQVLFIDQVPED